MFSLGKYAIPALFILCAIFSGGCERSALENAEIRAEIDTLVNRQIKRIQPELDSICSNSMANWNKHYVDSILPIRKRQILGKLRTANE